MSAILLIAALGELAGKFETKGGVRYNRYLPDLEEIERQQASGAYEYLGPQRTSQESAIEAMRAQEASPERDAALREAETVAWTERRVSSQAICCWLWRASLTDCL